MAGFTSKEDGIRSILRNGGNSQQCKPLLPLQQLCLSVLWGLLHPCPYCLCYFISDHPSSFVKTLTDGTQSCFPFPAMSQSVCVEDPANPLFPQSLYIISGTGIYHDCTLATQSCCSKPPPFPPTMLFHLPIFIISPCSVLPHGQ